MKEKKNRATNEVCICECIKKPNKSAHKFSNNNKRKKK